MSNFSSVLNSPSQSFNQNNLNKVNNVSLSTTSTSSESTVSSSNNASLVVANNGSMSHNQTNKSTTMILNKHWSQKIYELIINTKSIKTEKFFNCINGGSDNGQFIYFVSNLSDSEYNIDSDKLILNDIILEIQNQKISGYTLYDVLKLLKKLSSSTQSLKFRTVKFTPNVSIDGNQNSTNTSSLLNLPLELRSYLDERFQKGSIDYDLQQTIRENVYMRTVPCTTRAPRNGEIDGQDYIFLHNDQFLELEQNGQLLEYGVYNGHYYGTPKPPKEPINQMPLQLEEEINDINGQQQPKRNNSIADMKTISSIKQTAINEDLKTNDLDGLNKHERENVSTDNRIELNIINSENNMTNNNLDKIILDDKSNNPNENSNGNEFNTSSNINNNEAFGILPYGWEKVDDPEYGTFFIDHVNKQTTYENPLNQQQQTIDLNSNNSSMKTFKPTANKKLINIEQFASQKLNNSNNNFSINRQNIDFTQNPSELKGDFIKTSLLKTPNGFGFTIIGANETSEDFLQIKYIVPDGAAHNDGKLCQGDVLVYVNNECVLGYTHQNVVEIFQSIPIGNYVDLTICRGYPLSIDPNDPNIEIMSLAAINNPNLKIQQNLQAPLAVVDELTTSTLMNSTSSNFNNTTKQPLILNPQTNTINDYDEYYCEEYEEMYAPIVKGLKGFGFTIADDSQLNQQKVKQILDKERCANLNENDILLEINGIDLRYLSHNQVVDVLKDCPKGKETIIKLKRRKYQIILPQVPNNSTLNINNLTPTQIKNLNNSTGINNNKFLRNNLENLKTNNLNDLIQQEQNNLNLNSTSFNETLSSPQVAKVLDQNQSIPLDGGNENFKDVENRPISVTNRPIRNDSPNHQRKFKINQDNYLYNPNQIFFNYNRRSKTPNILQSSSSNTCFLNNNTSISNPSLQLRSKTPTTDRMLFQSTFNNEYVYSNNNHNSYSNLLNTTDMYSRVNNKKNSQLDPTDDRLLTNNIKSESMISKSHIPIYDSTTNIQHQRVLKNLNKFNNLNAKSNTTDQLTENRSKTPGPETIYFRSSNNNQFSKPSTFSAATFQNSQFSYYNRSKTPTADILYYPSSKYNNPNIMFDSIYQPFNVNNQQKYCINDYNSDESFINLLQQSFNKENKEEYCSQYNSENYNNNQIAACSDVDGNHYMELTTELNRQESGFGFRIVGGEEEGSQVAIGFIVKGGAAHLDNNLRPNDEIIMIDNECVLGATHRRVVQLMTIAGLNRKVKLMVRRKITNEQYELFQNYNNQQKNQTHQSEKTKNNPHSLTRKSNMVSTNNISTPSIGINKAGNYNSNMYPYTITLFRNGSEGFGFVIISTLNKNGPSIGKIVENSPADRCKRLNVGDRILAVNGINITQMNHIEIVNLIKESGNSIALTIGSPLSEEESLNQPITSISSAYIINGISTLKSQDGTIESCNIQESISPNYIPKQSSPQIQTKVKINQNEYHVIELRKHQSNGFGFSIRGGKEFNIPLFVLKLAEGGSATLDGRLQIGDQILEINGHDAYNMSHSEAIERIKSSGNMVTLLIRRTGLPPPSITDIIAANSNSQTINQSNTTYNTEIVKQNQLRSKSPYLNHQVKQYNSSGTLNNRNF